MRRNQPTRIALRREVIRQLTGLEFDRVAGGRDTRDATCPLPIVETHDTTCPL
jgi:hypothetical protein